jgi:MFS family permease
MVFSILIGLFLFALDNTIVADSQPVIVKDFAAVDKVAWLAAAFMIPGAALMLPMGQMFQVFNAKWLYILGVVVFEIGSAVCGGAPTMDILIAGRAIAGTGSTAIYTGSLFLITVFTSENERYVRANPG